MAADDLVRIFERENPHDAPVQRPARSKRIRATTVDFDSPDIASSREASVEPADTDLLAAWARTKKTHWAQSLSQKERTRINGLVLLARAAVAFRAKHGRFPRKLRRGFFNLVHRLGRIKGKLTGLPRGLHGIGLWQAGLPDQMFQGHPRRFAAVRRRPTHGYKAEVQVKDSPGVECWECPNPRQAHITLGHFSHSTSPLAPPTSTPVIMPPTTVPRLTPDVTPADPGWEQLLCETFAPKFKAPVATPPSCRLWRPPPPSFLSPPRCRCFPSRIRCPCLTSPSSRPSGKHT